MSTPPQGRPVSAVQASPAPAVSPALWDRIDHAIWTASLASEGLAEAYALSAVEEWLARVRRRTEGHFIPWYSDYWTQKWLGMKVSWYRLTRSEDDPTAASRLAVYLQEQYQARVLEPIGDEIDPVRITDRATGLYLDGLRNTLGELPQHFTVAPATLDLRLAAIPAIAPPPPSEAASLHQVLQVRDIADLPAYRALTGRDAQTGDIADSPASRAGMQSAADRILSRLPLQLALQGGGTVALLLGGVPGILISAGLSGWDVAQHAQDQPEMASQISRALDRALAEVRRDLLADAPGGVLVPVRHLSAQVESCLARPYRP